MSYYEGGRIWAELQQKRGKKPMGDQSLFTFLNTELEWNVVSGHENRKNTLDLFFVFSINMDKEVLIWVTNFSNYSCLSLSLLAKPSRKLTFLYLANDVIQNSKRKGPEFTKDFAPVIVEAFKHVSRYSILLRAVSFVILYLRCSREVLSASLLTQLVFVCYFCTWKSC